MSGVRAADAYEFVDDLWLVTAYFNPAGHRTRAENYQRFKERIASTGLHLTTIECAFGSAAFTLPASSDVVHVRARDVMWQKERLLNMAIAALPSRCTKVAWLDCDLLFENPRWAVETSRWLDRYAMVQLYDRIIKLPPGAVDGAAGGDELRSFGAAYASDPRGLLSGDYNRHGEAGGAWAARREVLACHGLYDACIIGGGDHVLVHAMCGDWRSVCIERLLGRRNAHRRHFVRWAKPFYRTVRGGFGCVGGSILHLWHGAPADRRYSLRHRELETFRFNPTKDLRFDAHGCWEWASEKPDLHRWAAAYFAQRNEDGAPPLSLQDIESPAVPLTAPRPDRQ